MINRDKIRSIQLIKNLNECPLGSGAIAGTNFFEGRKILNESGLKLISAENLDDAAQKIVKAVE